MSASIFPCPGPPDWRVDWDTLDREYPWIRRLADCPQDPRHHAEGNVWIHLRMVCAELAALPAWRALPEVERATVFAAVLLHDVAKPDCTRTEPDGRVTAPGHSRRGAILARQILWRLGMPFARREQVAALVRYHQTPFHLLANADSLRKAVTVSMTARCDLLAIVAEADARGRVTADQQHILDNVALFTEYCREHDCLDHPRSFASAHARFLYFRDERRHPDSAAHDDCRAEVVALSGFPGAGKNHWIAHHLPDWPVVALDDIRRELDVDPRESQGEVLNAARAQAREYLRQGRSFVWNATNLSRQVRGNWLGLFADYRARVRIVYLEVPEAVLLRQNRQRAHAVPAAVIERLLDRWEVPDLTEAHQVEYVVRERDD
jgi:predicted kinase